MRNITSIEGGTFIYACGSPLTGLPSGFSRRAPLAHKREFNNALRILISVTPSNLSAANEY